MQSLTYEDISQLATTVATNNNMDLNSIKINQNDSGRYSVEINYLYDYVRGITFYVPSDTSNTTTISTYVHGSDGSEIVRQCVDYENSNTTSAISIYPRGHTNYDSTVDTIVTTINTIEKELNINTVEYATQGFSSGDHGCLNISTALLKTKPDAYHNITYIDPKRDQVNAYGNGSNVSKMTPEDSLLFKQDNVHITAYMTEHTYIDNESNDSWLRNFYSPFEDNENFLLVADGTIGEHGNYRDRIIAAGVMEGGFDWIDKIGESNESLEMKTRYLNPNGNNYQFKDFANKIKNKITQATQTIQTQEIIEITTEDKLTETPKEPKKEKLFNKNPFELIKNAIQRGKDSPVESDTELVENNLITINSLINSSTIANTDLDRLEDESGTQTCKTVKNLYNCFLDDSKILLQKLSNTGINISKISDSINNLDLNLANMIEDGKEKISAYNDKLSSTISERLLFNDNQNSNKMKLNIDELRSYIQESNPKLSLLSNDISDTNNLKNNIKSMAENFKSNLQGDAWNTVIDKLNVFDEVFEKKNNYAQELKTNIKNAYTSLINYLDKYNLDEIDTSKAPEFEQQLQELEMTKSSLTETLNSLKASHGSPIYGTDLKGNIIVTGYIDNSSSINSYIVQINNVDNLIKIVNRTLEGIYGLPEADRIASTIASNNTDYSQEFNDSRLDNISSITADF